jgi:EpsD family peptidyl-prolyl cis-trans isomerase
LKRNDCGQRLVGLALAGALLVLAACEKQGPAEATQIAAQVNEGEVSVHQVQALMRLQPAATAQWGEQAAPRMLDSLIEQELAAQAAQKAGLDTSPAVLQALALARREVLARAYQDQLAEKAVMPDDEAISLYHEQHPELFARRRQYQLRETLVKTSVDQAKALKLKVDHIGKPGDIEDLLASSQLAHSSRETTQWAESLPMDFLPQLAFLRDGQSISVLRPDGLMILTLVHAEEAPMTRGQAAPAIQSVLSNVRRKEAVQKGMNALRAQAKITKFGPFAAAASAPTTASAASVP